MKTLPFALLLLLLVAPGAFAQAYPSRPIEVVVHTGAGGGNDLVCAGGGKDSVDGGLGNDVAYGGGGNDTLRGGAGSDPVGKAQFR